MARDWVQTTAGQFMACGVTYLVFLVFLGFNVVPQFINVVVLTSTMLAAICGHYALGQC